MKGNIQPTAYLTKSLPKLLRASSLRRKHPLALGLLIGALPSCVALSACTLWVTIPTLSKAPFRAACRLKACSAASHQAAVFLSSVISFAAMSLSELLKTEGLSDALIKVAVDAGWSITTFKHAADSPAELEKVIPEIFGSSELSRLQS